MTGRVISLSGQLTRNSISTSTIQLAFDLTMSPNGEHIVRKIFCSVHHQVREELVTVQ
jgi:hypothetical protein